MLKNKEIQTDGFTIDVKKKTTFAIWRKKN